MNDTIAATIQKLYGTTVRPTLTRPEAQFGDFATNVALQLAKQLGKNPREIAEEIAVELRHNEDFREVSVAGPGFINIFVADAALVGLCYQNPTQQLTGRTIVIETNNPNPFKAMHIGHAMNATTADTIANLLALDGANLYRVSYHGDVGLHVGKSMYALLKFADGDIAKIEAIKPEDRNSFMSKMYAEGSKAYKESEEAKAEIDDLAAQSFTPKTALYITIYELCKKWSFEQIDATVARLGNQPIVYRFLESDADHRGVEIVRKNTPKVFTESDGAYVFEGSKYGSFDNVFVSRTGRGLYAARDLGLMQLKNEQFHPDKSYIVTAEEQKAYFKGVIAAAGLAMPELAGETVNISTGTVKLTTGKMSSRDGDVVEISWLFDEFARAIEARGGVVNDEIIAGALRYQFLKVKIGGDIVFDINEAVSLTGNTGSYLQYAYARANQILTKVEQPVARLDEVRDEDRSLLRKISEFAEIVNVAKSKLEPHHICNYLFELAQEFNRYYEKNQVVGSDQERHRASLVGLYADTLKAGLFILGIKSPEKM